MRPLLTIWRIYNPNNEDEWFYRWTLKYYNIFVTSETEFIYKGHCRRRGIEWAQEHDYNDLDLEYKDRTNIEFLA